MGERVYSPMCVENRDALSNVASAVLAVVLRALSRPFTQPDQAKSDNEFAV